MKNPSKTTSGRKQSNITTTDNRPNTINTKAIVNFDLFTTYATKQRLNKTCVTFVVVVVILLLLPFNL